MGEKTAGDQETTHVYTVHRGDMMIDAPVERVWPWVIDYASWQNYSIQENVSGEPGAEGEVVRLKKDEPGSSGTPYLARTILIEPERRIIWKTFMEDAPYFGIVEFEVEDVDGRTRFSYRTLYENVLPTTDPDEVAEFRRERTVGIEEMVASIFPKLKEYAEAGVARSR